MSVDMERVGSIAGILDQHQVGEPWGGTASQAECACSCGYVARYPSGLRAWAHKRALQHVAEQIAEALA